ncbi:MAG: deoxyribodipyrimidine photo-lyase [Sphingobacteriia bacterium]|nr:MAG: deoxyribodipyrimidine photo-lyase [Sphingobacteriia bacterium]
MRPSISICWFRRDLRLRDQHALWQALNGEEKVLPVFIFDREILDLLPPADKRVAFIHQTLSTLHHWLNEKGSGFWFFYGKPAAAFKALQESFDIKKVYANHDYEPYARERDQSIGAELAAKGIGFETFKDQVIFEKDEVTKDDGKPYTVFTPYAKKWKQKLLASPIPRYPTETKTDRFLLWEADPIPSLQSMGFEEMEKDFFPPAKLDPDTLKQYSQNRNFPAMEKGTSRLGLHLRFGTLSIRQLATEAQTGNETYLNELIWRDFYHAILWHFPRVGKGLSFKPEYDNIAWRHHEADFEKWCQGKTGYPLVDAGMRELNATGFMHNRVRMVVASFLTKHLLIDWRWGEAYFAQQLLDFDLAANNGGWQWASGSGCDAAPYFRVFNPTLQWQKFDPQSKYVKRWVPEWGTTAYASPMVVHEDARKRALEVYGAALKSGK